jgi:hypothetical protein
VKGSNVNNVCANKPRTPNFGRRFLSARGIRKNAVLLSAGMKFRGKNKFRFGIPAYTGRYQALVIYKIKQTADNN